MNIPRCVPKQADTEIEGAFMCLQVALKTSRLGKPYYELLLADESGAIPGYCLVSNDRTIASLQNVYAAKIRGRVRLRPRGWVVEILDAEEYWPEFSTLNDALRIFPSDICPKPAALNDFKALLRKLSIGPLINFVHAVITDERITLPFLQVPASIDHHHHEDGGLLFHSVECAQIAETFPHLDALEKELAIVGALFHDIGKIETFACDGQRTKTGFLIDHDALTLEILSRHLHDLKLNWVDGAIALRYIWTWQSGFQKDRYPRLLAAEAVRSADRISAGADARELAFDGHPQWHQHATLQGFGPATRFWRVSAPA